MLPQRAANIGVPHSAVICTTGEILSSCMTPEIGMFRAQDSRPSSLLRCRAGAVHGCVEEGNYVLGFFSNPKQDKRSLIVEWKNGWCGRNLSIRRNCLVWEHLRGVCVVGENFDGFFFTSVKYSACVFSNLYPFCEVERIWLDFMQLVYCESLWGFASILRWFLFVCLWFSSNVWASAPWRQKHLRKINVKIPCAATAGSGNLTKICQLS